MDSVHTCNCVQFPQEGGVTHEWAMQLCGLIQKRNRRLIVMIEVY